MFAVTLWASVWISRRGQVRPSLCRARLFLLTTSLVAVITPDPNLAIDQVSLSRLPDCVLVW